jgi:outer membrane biogenesis lipoprotein LolB
MACSTAPQGYGDEANGEVGGSCAPVTPTVPPSIPASAQPTPVATTPATRAMPHIDLQGQLSIKLSAFADQSAKGISLGFFFNGNADAGQLDLITLMGSQMAQVNWTPDAAWLTNDKGKHPYASLGELSQAALGESLPLRSMVYWMQGLADPDLAVIAGTEPDTFTQVGWTIDTRQLRDKKLLAQRPGTATQRGAQIKIYLDH